MKSGSASKYFHDVPIYRCSPEEHQALLESLRERNRQYLISHTPKGFPLDNAIETADRFFDNRQWYSWQFNEIVGWLRLYALGNQLRGELWFHNAKRLRHDRKKGRITYHGKAFELSIPPTASNNDVFQLLLAELKDIASRQILRRRYIDLSCLKTFAPYIKWADLVQI